jgi:hypothetical protein
MILIDNKMDTVNSVIFYGIYKVEINIKDSRWDIWLLEDIQIGRLINSNDLICNIRNDINR